MGQTATITVKRLIKTASNYRIVRSQMLQEGLEWNRRHPERKKMSSMCSWKVKCMAQVSQSEGITKFSARKTLNAFFSKLHFSNRATMVLGDYRTYQFEILTVASHLYCLVNDVRFFCYHCNFFFIVNNLLFIFRSKIETIFYKTAIFRKIDVKLKTYVLY